MGESKRRKSNQGTLYGNPEKDRVIRSLPITKGQTKFLYKFTITGTWICIGVIAAFWVIFRIGVAMKWWGIS
jgi:hypothetical protein